MFSVKGLGSINSSTKSIASGVCFGFSDKAISFEVSSMVIDAPLLLRFYLKSDPLKPSVQFEVGDIKSGNEIDVVFYNVNDGGNAGLVVPSDIIKVQGTQLSMMFRVDRAFKADSYSLMYEFFERTLEGGDYE